MTTKQMTLITDARKLDEAIIKIARAGTKLTNDVQLAGVSAIALMSKANDIGSVNRLYVAVAGSKGMRASALASWLLTYCAVNANVDPATKKDKPFVYAKDKQYNVEGAAADLWANHKPDADPDEVFDLQKALAVLVKKAKAKALADGQDHLLTKLDALATAAADPLA